MPVLLRLLRASPRPLPPAFSAPAAVRLSPCPFSPLLSLSAALPVCSCLVRPPLVPPAAGRPPALRLVACWQLVFCCAARPFALPRACLSASRPVLSASSATRPPLLARSFLQCCLACYASFLFHSDSGASLLLFSVRAVRAAGWAFGLAAFACSPGFWFGRGGFLLRCSGDVFLLDTTLKITSSEACSHREDHMFALTRTGTYY